MRKAGLTFFPQSFSSSSRTVRWAAGAIALSMAGNAHSQTLFHLLYQPVVGEVHHYKISVAFAYPDGNLTFDSDLEVKVVKVTSTGDYTVQTSTTNAFIHSGDNRKELPPQAPVTSTYSRTGLPKGDSLKDREKDPFSDLLQHLTEYESPVFGVRIGTDWTNHPVGPKTSLFGQPRLNYHLADVFQDGGKHFVRIHYSASAADDPEAATGTLILDHSNNHLYQMQAEIPHFKPEGTTEEADMRISLREFSPAPIKNGTNGAVAHQAAH